MRKLLAGRRALQLLLAMAFIVAGCVANPVKEIPDLEIVSIGAITSKLAGDIKPGVSQSDESASFRHWHHYFQYCRGCYERRLLDQQFFGAYRPACDARKGKLSYQPSIQSPRRIDCLSSSGALLFAIFAKVESKTVSGVGTATLWFIS